MSDFLPTEIDFTEDQLNVAIQRPIFQLADDPGAFYSVKFETGIRGSDTIFGKISTLFKDDELFAGEDGIYTWIIGTELNRDLTSNGIPRTCDVARMHLWCKRVESIQEIATKHHNIIGELMRNKRILTEGSSEDDIKMVQHNGVIDYILYAGELKKRTMITGAARTRGGKHQECILEINFLSGSYMSEIVNASNPSDFTTDCVRNVFMNFAPVNFELNVVFDRSGSTFIIEGMNKDLLNEYIRRGLLLAYRYPTKEAATSASSFNIKLVTLENEINTKKIVLNRYGDTKDGKYSLELQQLEAKKEELIAEHMRNEEAARIRLPDIRYGGLRKSRKKMHRKLRMRDRKTRRRNSRKSRKSRKSRRARK